MKEDHDGDLAGENMVQLNKTVHWEIAKLLELGISEEWLKNANPTSANKGPAQRLPIP